MAHRLMTVLISVPWYGWHLTIVIISQDYFKKRKAGEKIEYKAGDCEIPRDKSEDGIGTRPSSRAFEANKITRIKDANEHPFFVIKSNFALWQNDMISVELPILFALGLIFKNQHWTQIDGYMI